MYLKIKKIKKSINLTQFSNVYFLKNIYKQNCIIFFMKSLFVINMFLGNNNNDHSFL